MLEKSLAASAPEYFPSVPPPVSNSPLPDVKEELDPLDSKHAQLLDEQQREAERKEAESITRLDELMRYVWDLSTFLRAPETCPPGPWLRRSHNMSPQWIT
jgi:hypothetical protein